MTQFHHENFDDPVKPQGWETWSANEPSPLSWNGSELLLTKGAGFAHGVFYQFQAKTNIEVEFRFRASAIPTNFIEIADLYDAHLNETDLNEECNIYYHRDGRISLFIGWGSIKIAEPIPVGQWIWLRLRYTVIEGITSSGDLAWSKDRIYPTSGSRFIASSRGYYSKPVKMLLFGPVTQTGIVFAYDDLTLYSSSEVSMQPVGDLRATWIGNSIIAEWTDKSVGISGHELEMRIRPVSGQTFGPWSNEILIPRK